jgi:hypothetical protein
VTSPRLSALEIHVGWQEDPVDFATAFTWHLSNVTSLAMSGPMYIPSVRERVRSTLSDFSTFIPNIVNLDISHATEVAIDGLFGESDENFGYLRKLMLSKESSGLRGGTKKL